MWPDQKPAPWGVWAAKAVKAYLAGAPETPTLRGIQARLGRALLGAQDDQAWTALQALAPRRLTPDELDDWRASRASRASIVKPRDEAAEAAAIAAEEAREARLAAILARRQARKPDQSPAAAESSAPPAQAPVWAFTGGIQGGAAAGPGAAWGSSSGPLAMPWRSRILRGFAPGGAKNWLDVGQYCWNFNPDRPVHGAKTWDAGLPRASWSLVTLPDGSRRLIQARRGNAPGETGAPFNGVRREFRVSPGKVAHLVGDARDYADF